MYRHSRRPSYEVYDLNESSTFTTPAQRQQPQAPRPSSNHSAESRPTSASGGPRYLRRTRRTSDTRQLPQHQSHRRAVSLDTSARQQQRQQQQQQPAQPQPSRSIPVSVHPTQESGIAALRPALSEAHTDENGSTVDDPYQLLDSSYWPWRTTAVSSRTASAILYALEDAIRRPFTFTTDWDEVNASMSDMVGVAGPVGNGRAQNGASRIPQPPAPVSTHPPSGVRTPTDIMRQRRDREARRKAEQEAREKEQEDLERQQLEQEQSQIQAQAQAQAQQYAAGAAGVAGDPASQRRTQPPRVPRGAQPAPEPIAGPSFRPGATAGAPSTSAPGYQGPSPAAAAAAADIPAQARPDPSSSQQQFASASAPRHARSQSAAAGTGGQTGTGGYSGSGQAPASQSGAPQSLQQPKRAGFPHAFERWETLSSHWEGLTSYWIRKLEQHNDDLEKDPLSQQLARQITDLSAAGANLFHAVVELQRLRASSERKFQRWFFDTRAEQERAKELQADLERQLKTERQGRADAFAASQTAEQDKTRSEELLKEMRRELQISREEARRAWEELGRREQEERERTNSLRNGEPTLVGGVQVVPMVQGLPSRHATQPPSREGQYAGGPPANSMGTEYQGKSTDPSASHHYYDEGVPMSPTGSDPFIEPKKTDPPSSKPAYADQHYEHDPSSAAYHGAPISEPDDRSYVGSSEAGDDDYAHYPPQSTLTYPPPPLSEGSEEYDDGGHYVTDGTYTSAPTSAPLHAPYPPTTIDYSGSGWGPGTGWESVTPRHRHPTRLSDVLEEDEPSRTSPSRASQASRSQAGRSQAGRSVQ